MRFGQSTGISLSLLLLSSCFLGCSGANPTGNTSGGGPVGPSFVAPTSGDYLLQVPNYQGVSVSTINTSTGAVATPVALGSDSSDVQGGIAVTPSNSFLYSLCVGEDAIVGYRLIGPGLQLQLLTLSPTGPPLGTKSNPNSITIHPNGNFLYIIEAGSSGYIEQFSINASTGTLQQIGTQTEASADMRYGVIDPAGRFLFVNDLSGGRIFVYQINQSTGALSSAPGSPFTVPASGQPIQVALDSTGSFLYAPLYKGGMAAFAVNPSTGALTNVAGSPFPTAQDSSTPASIAINSATNTIYVSNYPDSNITEFAINETTGVPSLLTGSPVTVSGAMYGYTLTNLVVDSNAGVLFGATYTKTNNINAMTIGAASGSLSVLSGAPYAGAPYTTDLYHVKIP